MAKCKYCGAEISRLDKDNCPFCGGKKPLEGGDFATQDITKTLEEVKAEMDIPNPKSKIVAAILAFVLGIFGAHAIYLGKYKIALITFGISVVSIAALGCILFFTVLNNVWAFLIPLLIMEVLMIGTGVSFLVRHDISDSKGEFLK